MAQDADDVIPGLLQAIVLVNDAIALAETARNHNPSTEEERALNRLLLRLNAELDAALDESPSVQGPTRAQIAQIEALSNQVEEAANKNATVSARIALAGDVLDLAIKVVKRA